MYTRRLLPILVMLVALAGGCGGTTAQVQVTSPMSEEAEAAFENGIDFIDDPSILEGQWLTAWEDDIDRRVSLSDAIALVTITTVREDVDLDRRQTYRLIARIDSARHGELPEEVTLVSRHGDRGFGTVSGSSERFLNQRFVLFVKWADVDGRVEPRWHLSPASERVVRRVNSLIERSHTPEEDRRRVIITDHDGLDDAEEE